MNRAKKQSTKTTRWWYDIYLQFGSVNPPHPASEGYIDKETRPSMAEILDKIFERTDGTHYLANIEKVGAIEKQSIDIGKFIEELRIKIKFKDYNDPIRIMVCNIRKE